MSDFIIQGNGSGAGTFTLQSPNISGNLTLTAPAADGTNGQALVTNGSGVLSFATVGSGDVVGPASATDNAVVRFDGTTGKLVQNSAVTVADTTGNMTGGTYNGLTVTTTTGTLTITNGKTLAASNTLTLAGTDSTTMTFPSTSASIARTDAAQTFTGTQTFSSPIAVGSGGTGLSATPTNGQIDIGNGTGFTRTTLTAGSGIAITNGAGSISIAATGGGGSPGGSTTQVQYNNAGAFGGISGFTTDGTRVTASTTIGVGGATPSTSGNGITFPATASLSTNPNTLDDYEEGTWTPTDQSGAGLTFSTSSSCKYIKIGQMVTIVGLIVYPTTSSSSNASIGGLPYVAGPGTICGVTPGIIGNGTTTYINVNIADSPNPNTLLRIYSINNVPLTNVQLSGAGFYLSLTYFSTSTT